MEWKATRRRLCIFLWLADMIVLPVVI